MALAFFDSAALSCLEAVAVTVEVDAKALDEKQLLIIVGLPDIAVKESKDRVLAAVKNSGFSLGGLYGVINLAPGDLRKEGPLYDLPIALGLLRALGLIPHSDLFNDYLVIGELSLGGQLRPLCGGLSMAMLARHMGKKGILLPKANAREASAVPGIAIHPVEHLSQAVAFFQDPKSLPSLNEELSKDIFSSASPLIDFADIKGQTSVKRAMEIAAAGAHNVVLSGPPGAGKTMLAKAFSGIMPPFTLEESLEATRIHSVAGLLSEGQSLLLQRPFRSPHHTVSYAGLIGGGVIPRPGEVSLAHNGVLFLDELPEFSRTVLEVLRQPLEDRHVTISRANGSYTFPTNFICVAAMNPCPCGFLGHPDKPCKDSPQQINRYRSKISGPIWDRIDMHIDVPALRYKELLSAPTGESSKEVLARVAKARAIQYQRLGNGRCNGAMSSREVKRHCPLDSACHELLRHVIDEQGASARRCDRLLRVARTIADLDGTEEMTSQHLLEAINFRRH